MTTQLLFTIFLIAGGGPEAKAESQQRRISSERADEIAMPSMAFPLTPSKIREVQEALNEKQGAMLSVDGTMNQNTIAAIKSFQKQQQVPATGILDSQTLALLGLSQTETLDRAPASVPPIITPEKVTPENKERTPLWTPMKERY